MEVVYFIVPVISIKTSCCCCFSFVQLAIFLFFSWILSYVIRDIFTAADQNRVCTADFLKKLNVFHVCLNKKKTKLNITGKTLVFLALNCVKNCNKSSLKSYFLWSLLFTQFEWWMLFFRFVWFFLLIIFNDYSWINLKCICKFRTCVFFLTFFLLLWIQVFFARNFNHWKHVAPIRIWIIF